MKLEKINEQIQKEGEVKTKTSLSNVAKLSEQAIKLIGCMNSFERIQQSEQIRKFISNLVGLHMGYTYKKEFDPDPNLSVLANHLYDMINSTEECYGGYEKLYQELKRMQVARSRPE